MCSFVNVFHFISFHFIYRRSFVTFLLSPCVWVCYVTLPRCRCHLWSENAAVSYDRNEKFVIQLNTRTSCDSWVRARAGWRKDRVKYEISLAFKITGEKWKMNCAMCVRMSTWHFHGLCVSKSHKEVCLPNCLIASQPACLHTLAKYAHQMHIFTSF